MFILLYGMSGSGKSTISREIYEYLMEKHITCTVIPMDYFYKEGPQESFDVPDAFDFQKLRDCIATLQNNRPYTIYQYDYEMNTYMKHKAYTLYNSKVILIEGLYANYCRFLFLQNPVVLRVSTLPDICLARRVLRDVKERGISPQKNIVAWIQDVRPMWDKYNRFGLTNEHVLEHTHLIPGDDNAKLERLSMIDVILYESIM